MSEEKKSSREERKSELIRTRKIAIDDTYRERMDDINAQKLIMVSKVRQDMSRGANKAMKQRETLMKDHRKRIANERQAIKKLQKEMIARAKKFCEARMRELDKEEANLRERTLAEKEEMLVPVKTTYDTNMAEVDQLVKDETAKAEKERKDALEKLDVWAKDEEGTKKEKKKGEAKKKKAASG